jgi:hypothetical protein
MKHTAGMCGVGKFMKRWGELKEDKCPRCGELEDAPRVWICKGEGVPDIWELTGWRLGINPAYGAPAGYQEAINNQDQIGWHRLIEGWIAKDWAAI